MKIHKMSYIVGFVMVAAGITAIAEESKLPALSDSEYTGLTSSYSKAKDCIFSNTISNWTILDDRSLILYAPTRKRPFYVKLATRSHELRFAHAIGVYSKFDNRFCPYGGNALFIDGNRNLIQAIKKIDGDTAKQLVAYHKAKKAQKKGM